MVDRTTRDKLCPTCAQDDWVRVGRRQWWKCRRCRLEANKRYQRAQGPWYYLLANARMRAKRFGVPCTVRIADIVIPATCPVLGIPLAVAPFEGRRAPSPGSPSLDRVIPALGYVPGNIRVISHRANTLKNNATIAELEAVLTYCRLNQET